MIQEEGDSFSFQLWEKAVPKYAPSAALRRSAWVLKRCILLKQGHSTIDSHMHFDRVSSFCVYRYWGFQPEFLHCETTVLGAKLANAGEALGLGRAPSLHLAVLTDVAVAQMEVVTLPICCHVCLHFPVCFDIIWLAWSCRGCSERAHVNLKREGFFQRKGSKEPLVEVRA